MPAPDKLLRLIEVFDRNVDAYRRGAINETETRVQFIDPLFELLGWDVRNTRGYTELYKDVVHEDAVSIEGTSRAPDYSFRIGGQRVFFLEAKKPAVNIEQDCNPALQLRRYGWTCKLPVSILTDFEELAVYDTRVKPLKTDKVSVARVQFHTYKQYAECWDQIAGVFSKEAVLQGSFHKYTESATAKKGTTEVDAEFLKDIESWRDLLARTIALRNASISQRELNFAVQKIIDRVVFLRMCEDRGIEPYGQLLSLTNGTQTYQRLVEVFLKADQRYNSGLFHFHHEKDVVESPDDLTPRLVIDDKPLKEIFHTLYYPDCPYQFSVLPIQILGDVYEQFLGKVIRLTAGHQAKVEEKPEVKKAGGVKYTPAFVTSNIVKNTVGALVEKAVATCRATGNDAAKVFAAVLAAVDNLKICDPACGSGSFLIAAFQYLLDWYLQWYVEHQALALKMKPARVYQTGGGDWRLTTAEKKRILLNSIYGVDIDGQAVEVTKLSLVLKVLEGENQESLGRQLSLFHERALPDLSSNIKCGNSLIGPDFYEHQQMDLLDEAERIRINVFDWQSAFPDVFKRQNAGFDAIVGNPPYIRIQVMKEWAANEVEYYKTAYASASKGNYDIYVVFVEKGLQLLNGNGLLGYILPHKFFNAQYGEPLRKVISDGKHLNQVIHFGDQQVFKGVTTYTCLLFLSKLCSETCTVTKVADLDQWQIEYSNSITGIVKAETITTSEWNFNVGKGAGLFEKLRAMPVKLNDVADIFVGLQTSADKVFIMDLVKETTNTLSLFSKALDAERTLEKELFYPLISGADVKGYRDLPERQYILFPYKVDASGVALIALDDITRQYPKTFAYLIENKATLENRESGKLKGKAWHGYIYLKNMNKQSLRKLCVPRLVERINAAYDFEGTHFLDNVDVGGVTLKEGTAGLSLPYLQGLLNSRLLRWYFPFVSAPFHGGWYSANKQFLSQLPIRSIDFADPTDKQRHDQMVKYVDTMLALHKQLAKANTPDDRTQLENQIAATDRLIDKLVYELYELTQEEIGIMQETYS